MAYLEKVVWFEGMTLDPHHFQQLDRYLQGLLDARVRPGNPYGWGVAQLMIDKEGVVNGQFGLLRCLGVTRDGLPVDVPDTTPAPPVRTIAEFFPPTEQKLTVLLAIPVDRPGGLNTALPDRGLNRSARFVGKNRMVNDDNSGQDERSVMVGFANVEVRFSTESNDAYNTIPIAEVIRSADGGFALSSDYIPPVFTVGASDNLLNTIRRIIELLVAKHSALWGQKQQADGPYVARNEFTATLMLKTISAYIPLLHHHFATTRTTPEALYQVLLALTGELTAMSERIEVHPREFPVFDFDDLRGCFGKLEAILKRLLGEVSFEENYKIIPLERRGESRFMARELGADLLHNASFFLSASGDVPDSKMVSEFPSKLKIASPEHMAAVLQMAVRALPVEHVGRLPNGVPMEPKTHYFRFHKSGPYWDAIGRSLSMEVFVPTEFRNLQVELIAVFE